MGRIISRNQDRLGVRTPGVPAKNGGYERLGLFRGLGVRKCKREEL